jgi:hypothetical protein
LGADHRDRRDRDDPGQPPFGLDVDAGAAKTIKVWFGDQIRNGTTATSLSIEKGFLDQTTPTYIVNTGMQVNQFSLSMQSRQKITGSFAFMGMGGSQSTTTLDASPDAATTGAILAAQCACRARRGSGVTLGSPNWARQLDFQIANNLRAIEAVDSSSPGRHQPGECTVTGRVSVLFRRQCDAGEDLRRHADLDQRPGRAEQPGADLRLPVGDAHERRAGRERKKPGRGAGRAFSATLDPVTGVQ